ncbi:MAG: type II CAAX endopeptidase family protein, partial [Myxococcota bacterium]
FRELSRAGAGLMTLLVAVFVAQGIVLQALGALPAEEPLALEELRSRPDLLFGMVLTTGLVTAAMAVVFARRVLVRLLAHPSQLGVRAYLFGPLAAILAGQTIGFLTAALGARASDTGAVLTEGIVDSENTIFYLAVAAIALAAPIGEELFFRGFLLNSLNRSVGCGLALLFSSTLFGLMHFDPIQSFSATAIGMVLGIVALGSRSLWPAVFAHAVNNAFFLYLVRFIPEEIASPEAEWSALGNAGGFVLCLATTVGLVVLAVGRDRLNALFESDPLPDYG